MSAIGISLAAGFGIGLGIGLCIALAAAFILTWRTAEAGGWRTGYAVCQAEWQADNDRVKGGV